MSLYGRYIEEREGIKIIAHSDGFITYAINKKNCWIHDIFIVPKSRRYKLGSNLADQVVDIAKKEGCTMLGAQCVVNTKNITDSVKALLGYGFEVVSANGGIITFAKEI